MYNDVFGIIRGFHDGRMTTRNCSLSQKNAFGLNAKDRKSTSFRSNLERRNSENLQTKQHQNQYYGNEIRDFQKRRKSKISLIKIT